MTPRHCVKLSWVILLAPLSGLTAQGHIVLTILLAESETGVLNGDHKTAFVGGPMEILGCEVVKPALTAGHKTNTQPTALVRKTNSQTLKTHKTHKTDTARTQKTHTKHI